VWHITHRCHKKEFLLKFAKDRRRWLHWLLEAKKRYELSILNYMVTSNHIHLLVADNGDEKAISYSMQLVAGKTGQEYNQRKGRKGAYWEDRYHATAVDTEQYLAQCMTYIDMNMVRAGVVNHPGEWPHCGYWEIQSEKQRYKILDYDRLIELLNIASKDELTANSRERVEESLAREESMREEKWTKSIAVGREEFVEQIHKRLGVKGKGRTVRETIGGAYELRERPVPYRCNLPTENEALSLENEHFWNRNQINPYS
jgi:REP element-mobilizing transposase RayT